MKKKTGRLVFGGPNGATTRTRRPSRKSGPSDALYLSLPGRQEVPVDVESLPGARYRVARETDETGGLRTSSSSVEPERPARTPHASPRARIARWRAW